jgi:hypothetical protein
VRACRRCESHRNRNDVCRCHSFAHFCLETVAIAFALATAPARCGVVLRCNVLCCGVQGDFAP